MKNVSGLVGVFLLSFIIASGAIFYMNSTYFNIWKFDFRTIKQVEIQMKKEAQKAIADSIAALGLDINGVAIDSNETASNNKVVEEVENQPKQASQPIVDEDAELAAEEERLAYLEWAKKTAKIYESMTAGKAAKIIQNYSDSEAKDIIYYMNKKKAAGILALLDPKHVTRITRAD